MFKAMPAMALLSLMLLPAFGETPKVGQKAPDFNLPSTNGASVALNDYAGKAKLVLVFYRGYW
ncbi:MAG: redoxin domain-containing protein [Acidobacteria bacterium]|nr:redoxin domain-containing protein [Acidobacteriota bacterium]